MKSGVSQEVESLGIGIKVVNFIKNVQKRRHEQKQQETANPDETGRNPSKKKQRDFLIDLSRNDDQNGDTTVHNPGPWPLKVLNVVKKTHYCHFCNPEQHLSTLSRPKGIAGETGNIDDGNQREREEETGNIDVKQGREGGGTRPSIPSLQYIRVTVPLPGYISPLVSRLRSWLHHRSELSCREKKHRALART